MSTLDFIIALFCRIDDQLQENSKRKNAKLWHSELVTIASLWSLKGGSSRAFYRWLKRDYFSLFPSLPERSRLFRLIAIAEPFEADLTCLSILDSFGIELIHPWWEGRSPKQFGKKGLSNGRWIVGAKFCALVNQFGQISDWDDESAKASYLILHSQGQQSGHHMCTTDKSPDVWNEARRWKKLIPLQKSSPLL